MISAPKSSAGGPQASPSNTLFPPRPTGLKGRAAELATLVRAIDPSRPQRLALVGQGGCGKSVLACALGHRVRGAFGGRAHWFRVGAWDARTLAEMLALRFGTLRDRAALYRGLRRYLSAAGPMFVVLDNHEDDRAMAQFLDELRAVPVTWVITARRCLLSGVSIFPVTAPLATTGKSAFPRVAALTKLLRSNPLALDIADALVHSGAATTGGLADWLIDRGVERVRVVEHEDDLPEVSLLVEWAWRRLDGDAKKLLSVLAHVSGDHVGIDSLFALARVGRAGPRAIAQVCRWHLVQEPLQHRFALHAVVRYAIRKNKKTQPEPRRIFEHYVGLLERDPACLELEQSHLFAAMDFAHATSDLDAALRIDRLLRRFDESPPRRAHPSPT
ncbi:MAG TPA: hypothetical protein VF881_02730 [Polyangiaceae bacterium]